MSIFNKDCITEIKEEKISLTRSNDEHDLFDFESGVFFLGDYSYEERQEAKKLAISSIGKKEIYSFMSANCEHFTNWCFTKIPRSYQVEKLSRERSKFWRFLSIFN